MTNTVPDYKRQALKQRRAQLIEEYNAASAQLAQSLNEVDRVRLGRQIEHLERQIRETDTQLGQNQVTDDTQREMTVKPESEQHQSLQPDEQSNVNADARPRPKRKPITAQLWVWFLVVVLLGFILDVVVNLGSLLGLSRCVALWLASALVLVSGVAIFGFSLLPEQRSQHMKTERAILILLTFSITLVLGGVALASCTDGNRCPTVELVASPEQVCPGNRILLTTNAHDPEGDPLNFTWSSGEPGLISEGRVVPDASNVFVPQPGSAGKTVRIDVTVDDGHCGETVSASTAVRVLQCEQPPATDTLTASPSPTNTPIVTATDSPTATPTSMAAPQARVIAPSLDVRNGPGLTYLTNVQDGDRVPYVTSLLGGYASDEEVIRIFVVPPSASEGGSSNLYPQSINRCNGNDGAFVKDGRWEQPILVGLPITKDVGLPYDIVVTKATDEGNAAVLAEIQTWCDDNPEERWPGFAELPRGVTEVQRISVIRSDRESDPAPNPSGVQLPGQLEINNIQDGQQVGDQELLSGTFANVAADDSIWVLVYTSFGKWFPQSSAPCDGIHTTIPTETQWQVTSSFRDGKSGERYDVVVVVANREANAFFDQKQRQWCEEASGSPDYKWPGLFTIELPEGITEKDRIEVFHQ
jgi:hypothetical protein